MLSFRVFVVLPICIFVSSTQCSSQNNTAKITLEESSSAMNGVSGRQCSTSATDFDASPSSALLPVIPAIIAITTALILSVIAWGIVRLISSNDDDDDNKRYGAASSSQYFPNRMDLSQYENAYNFARNIGSSSSFGHLTNVVWKALENYSRSN